MEFPPLPPPRTPEAPTPKQRTGQLDFCPCPFLWPGAFLPAVHSQDKKLWMDDSLEGNGTKAWWVWGRKVRTRGHVWTEENVSRQSAQSDVE